jgi:hypothetical protein
MSDSGQPWWKGAVIYQIYPRSFQDSNGDGIGDLRGITRRLDHIARLGADAIWISPFFTSPMRDFGYDIADYCGVDPIFGTIEDFDALVARAHELGLKVTIDQVYAHSSDVPGKPREPDQCAAGLVCVGRSQAGRFTALQLAIGVRRSGLDLGRAAAAILYAPVPCQPAAA